MPDNPPTIPEFTLLRSIGRGAYGEVWLARSVTGIHRAVKIVRRDSFTEDRPFEREFTGIRRFEPVSVGQESQVSLLHVGRNEAGGFFYYVMELADDAETGEEIFPERYVPKTLKELRRRRNRLPAAECLDIGLALTRALEHLHANGLVHRDIKPSNVIFVHGTPKLADIGLVSHIDTSHSFVGTEGFVPPEGPGTTAADVYSLGKVLYEISTGRDRSEFPNLPDGLDDIPDRHALLELNEVILKACDFDLQRRYSSAAAMREDLLLAQAGRSIRRLHLMERRLRFIVKYGVLASVIAALAIAGFLWASAQTRRANENLQRAERAESEAKARLQEANFNLARANRLTGRAGFRFQSLPELAKAAEATNRLEYRNEAIACLALPDMRPLKHWAKTPHWDSFNFSHDFRVYGTNDSSGTIHIRDTATDVLLRTLPSRGVPLTGSVSSGDGRYVATSDAFGRAWLWTEGVDSPIEVPFRSTAKLIGFTPDNAFLLVLTSGDTLDFLSVTDGMRNHTLTGLPPSRSIQISPAGDHLMLVEANRVHIHRLPDGSRARTISLPDTVSASAWHPDGVRIAIVWGRNIAVYEVSSGAQCALAAGHESAIVGLTFTGSGEWLITASWDRTTRLWRADTGREVARLAVAGNGLRVSRDSQRLAFKSWDHRTAQLFELADTRVVRRFHVSSPRYTYRTVFHPSGRWLVLVDAAGLSFFDPLRPAPIARLEVPANANCAFLSDGRHMLTGGEDRLRLHSLNPADSPAGITFEPAGTDPNAHPGSIHNFLVSVDGRWCLAIPAAGARPFVFKLGRTNSIVKLDSGSIGIHFHGLNHDGSLAIARDDRHPTQVQLWDLRAGRPTSILDAGVTVRHTALSPDDRRIAVSGIGSTTIWSRDTFKLRHRILHPDTEENHHPLAFSPDGRTLAVAASDREIWLADVETGAILASLPVDRMVVAVGFSASGNQLVVTGESGWFDLWNLHLLRANLAALNLDWPGAPMSEVPEPPTTFPIKR